MNFLPTEDHVKVSGRTIYRDNVRYLGYSATSISFCFTGCKAQAVMISDPADWPEEQHARVGIFVNDNPEPSKRIELKELRQTIDLYEAKTPETVTITIMKYSEPEYAICGIEELIIDTDTLLAPPAPKNRKIQIIGDSITCGYGVEGSASDLLHDTAVENPTKSYSVKTARALDADFEIVAWNGKGVISAYIGEGDQADDSWLVPMLYEYTDAGCCQQFFHEPPSMWEKWDHFAIFMRSTPRQRSCVCWVLWIRHSAPLFSMPSRSFPRQMRMFPSNICSFHYRMRKTTVSEPSGIRPKPPMKKRLSL